MTKTSKTIQYRFPDIVWALICVYCDDRIEQRQRILMRNIKSSRIPYYFAHLDDTVTLTHIMYVVSEKKLIRKPPFQRHTSSFLLTKYFDEELANSFTSTDSIIRAYYQHPFSLQNQDQYTYSDSDLDTDELDLDYDSDYHPFSLQNPEQYHYSDSDPDSDYDSDCISDNDNAPGVRYHNCIEIENRYSILDV